MGGEGTGRKLDEQTRQRILMLSKSGVPSSAIAKRMGCSRRTVNRVMREESRKQ